MKRAILFLLVFGGLCVAGFYALRPKAPDYAAVRPVIGPAVQAVYATGTVEPSVMIPIAPRAGGRLMALSKDEGQSVKKGDILARMEDADVQKSMDSLQANLELAQKDYARKAILLSSGAVSKQNVDQALSTLKAARAALARGQVEIDYLKLISPEDGRILRRDGEAGEFIPAGQPVFWMERPTAYRITAEVDEEDIPLVQIGQEVLIRADAFPDKIFEGTVSALTPKGDSVSRSYRVRVALKDKSTPLMSGMSAETNIIIQRDARALLLPVGAVVEGKIWCIEGGKLVRKIVETGAKTSESVQIREGISSQDVVLKAPPSGLKEGDFVHFHIEDSWQ